jgi:hypothetical protein
VIKKLRRVTIEEIKQAPEKAKISPPNNMQRFKLPSTGISSF